MKRPAVMGLGIALLWAGAAGLASRLPAPSGLDGEDEPPAGDMVSRLFGSGREVISRQLFLEADRYFHQGVGHVREHAFTGHPYLRWAEAITPTDHVEAQGEGIAEIMPWLHMAARADPGNIQAYTTAAYWLGTQGDVEAAREVLGEARNQNPGDYRVSLALGQLLYRMKLHDQALVELARAREEWPAGEDAADKQVRLDLAAILSLEAGMNELKGHREEAMARFMQILRIFPGRTAVRSRLQQLEQGEDAAEAARFLDDQLSEISAAGDGRHVTGGGPGHEHDPSCGHDHAP